ncbi:hypothetical protein SMICM17S_09924 [Streptomyces microflavus]
MNGITIHFRRHKRGHQNMVELNDTMDRPLEAGENSIGPNQRDIIA